MKKKTFYILSAIVSIPLLFASFGSFQEENPKEFVLPEKSEWSDLQWEAFQDLLFIAEVAENSGVHSSISKEKMNIVATWAPKIKEISTLDQYKKFLKKVCDSIPNESVRFSVDSLSPTEVYEKDGKWVVVLRHPGDIPSVLQQLQVHSKEVVFDLRDFESGYTPLLDQLIVGIQKQKKDLFERSYVPITPANIHYLEALQKEIDHVYGSGSHQATVIAEAVAKMKKEYELGHEFVMIQEVSKNKPQQKHSQQGAQIEVLLSEDPSFGAQYLAYGLSEGAASPGVKYVRSAELPSGIGSIEVPIGYAD